MYALCSYQATFPFTFRNIIIHRSTLSHWPQEKHLINIIIICMQTAHMQWRIAKWMHE